MQQLQLVAIRKALAAHATTVCAVHNARSSFFQRVKSAIAWTIVCMAFIALVVGIMYGG